MSYVGSYVWKLRQKVGSQLLLLPGAQVLVLDDQGRCLLQKRSDNGLWELPAGACEEGDTFAATAARELEEETGLHVEEADLVPFASFSDPGLHTLTYPGGDVAQCFALCFAAHRWTGTVRPGADEVLRAGFFDPKDPPEPLYRATAAVLELYEVFRETGRFQAR
ncbi:NUDIX domain-containing protein [Streptomyces sp. NRRL WC-3742]|uniref:NUDIX domain-containing protein n=1 Tax=Streptomyces sp. NRRL WC-3742 TaxID=1463934 RepID=UPI0004C84696|nr:NUDIX domain-containing protein [Streptomyces sp. NRRL WC-3742]